MPYIKQKDREKFKGLKEIGSNSEGIGELNYVFTMIISGYLEKKGLKYQTCAEIRSALTDCRDEFYRRVVGPYEDEKIKENGDAY